MKHSSSPIESYLSYSLAAAHRAVHQALAARLKRHGVQVEAWRVLETLDSESRLTMGELADVVLMNPPTLTKLVDRMVSDGLVHRQVATGDHRQVNLMLTELGRKRMTQIREDVQAQDREIMGQIGTTEAQTLRALLQNLV